MQREETDFFKVLRITPHLFRQGVWPVAYDPVGGLQNQVWRITEELEKAGISQTVLTTYIPGYPRQSKHANSIRVKCVGISLPKFAASKLLGVTWFFSVAKHLLANCSAYDIVHIHYNHWIWCRVLTVIARRLNIPVVVSLSTELWVSIHPRWIVSGKHFNPLRWIERQAIKASACVIALTARDAIRWKTELKLKPERVVVIPDAIDAEKFRTQIENVTLRDFRRRYRIPKNKKVITYIGRIRREKGWQDLLPITTELSKSDAFLLICGDGPDRRKFENALRKNGCQGTWNITGYLDPEEIKATLQIADVLILPSRREAFGSVLLEAMASGVPAVAYAHDCIAEVAGTPNAIRLVPPVDRLAFTQAIIELLSDRQKCDDLIGRGYRRVRDFSLMSAARETVRCYQSLLWPDIPCDRRLHGSVELKS